MREIKFRAWSKEFNEMYNVKSLEFYNNKIWLDKIGQNYERIEDCIIMQFTGLHDKNGKEIYEGDIILNPLYEEPYIVEYSECLAGYVGWGDDRACGCYLITDENIEVIGNMHENKNLLT